MKNQPMSLFVFVFTVGIAAIQVLLCTGCTAPMIEKNYGVQVTIYATNVVWNVEGLVEKTYEVSPELKGSLK